MRSMFSGVSGLSIHQVRMDVIGDNIANVNTVGYKGSKANFKAIFSQMLKGAGAPQEGRGGTNPMQVGLGSALGAISVNHSNGSTERTDNPTDIMISGNGFFVVSNDAQGNNRFYTRAGNFEVDKLGYLVTPDGFKVLGIDGLPVRINKSEIQSASKTTGAEITGNLNFSYNENEINLPAEAIYATTVDAYNSVGMKTKITFDFGEKLSNDPATQTLVTPNGNCTFRTVRISAENAGTIGTLDLVGSNNAGTTNVAGGGQLFAQFDARGKFMGLFESIVTDADGNVTGATAFADSTFVIKSPGAEDIEIPVNSKLFENLKHNEKESDVKAVPLDGNSAGSLDKFSISAGGDVYGIFTNGERRILTTIGLALFDNPPGLMKAGNNLFIESPNSGAPKLGKPMSGSFGALTPGALEMSNVDLSKEFTNMITTQRGFQANSRVITTTDEMLQELVNLKR